MCNYENLDARKKLEQKITEDLKHAFGKRGLKVEHNGTLTSSAPGGRPDIELWDENYHIIIEATKTIKSSSDREFLSIKEHLENIKNLNPSKKCYCIYTSPETSSRMLNSIKEHNFVRNDKVDLKIIPLCFDNLDLILKKCSEAVPEIYPFNEIVQIFNKHAEFVDDQRIKGILYKTLFSNDDNLGEEIKKEEIEKDQKLLESLIKDLGTIEDYLREHGIATVGKPIDTLIYLVFMKLYEEKRMKDGLGKNRLKKDNFIAYKNDLPRNVRENNKAIHRLFDTIKGEKEFVDSGMFSESDNFVDSLDDDFVINVVIPIFDQYPDFLGTKVDALGAVYEILALRTERDEVIGQFFTPENVVSFMVKLAELDVHDTVLDPACGTGRFLIKAMDDMIKKVDKSSERHKETLRNNICLHQLCGTDIDDGIAKIAKMNMWFHRDHGDGKTNIMNHNGLLLDKLDERFENSVDIVFTNPPLGDLNYQDGYDDDFRDKMVILPLKNITEEKFKSIEKRIQNHQNGKLKLEKQKTNLEKLEIIKKYENLVNKTQNKDVKAKIRELKQNENVKEYLKVTKNIKSKIRTIENNEEQKTQLNALIRTGNCVYEVTGNKMKGGSLFINAISHYLKDDRDVEAYPEWRGGKLITIIDEGVLNTDDYSKVRRFIKKNFYIKAIISLSKDTFVPVSNTSTKTSILYAIKKQDPSSVQQEPIFYAHAEKVGMDRKKKVCANHLESILHKYFEFKDNLFKSYEGLQFNRQKFQDQGFEKGKI